MFKFLFNNWLVRKIVQKKGDKMLTNFFNRINGYKTYITVTVGAIVVIIGHFWGPLTLGGVSIPFVETSDMWRTIWEAISVAFLRKGVASVGTPSIPGK